ncbi:hypothetical protein EI168_02390 [Halomonas sp. FME1]|uniref:Uncharacterized protein n=1 Tax=Halomonas casei TaxID=2742613 RepID=A0ABR9EXK1_9GAMM|nr:hypothetical protein [Halomonas casei]MBE0398957.1 hypothetical protein [Halomonas casei]
MKISNTEVVLLKNKPLSRSEREKSTQEAQETQEAQARKPDDYSIFIRITGEYDGAPLIGLGEARPTRASGESLNSTLRYARKMARRLIGKQLDFTSQAPIEHVNDIVQNVIGDIFGISGNGASQQRPSPTVCFATECALLDLIAKKRGISVAQLTSSDKPVAVERNVYNDPLKNPERLIRSIAKGKQVSGWIRRGKRITGKDASALVNSLLFALSNNTHDLNGIILNAGQRWSTDEWNNFCAEVALTGLAAKQNVKIIVEDPFQEAADAFYQQAFAKMEGTPVSIMLSKPVWGRESISRLALYLPHVELKITPQKAGGYHEVLEAEKEAEQHGFKGGIFLAGVNGTTNLNTIAMVSLASAMRFNRYFSTSFKKEGKTRLVYPCVTLENSKLQIPEGPGFATNLCRSGVRKRSIELFAYSDKGRTSKREVRKALLESTYDDRFINRDLAEQERYSYSDKALEATLNSNH